jgi:hydroxyacylglutathione hydrolase
MITIKTVTVGPWPMNAYAIICPHTNASAIVDPGADLEALLAAIEGTTPVAVLLTHTHPDHVGALAETVQRLNVPLYAHPNAKASRFMPDLPYTPLVTGDTVTIGKHAFQVYETPGHIADMICFVEDENHVALVGDTLFEGGPGRTWSAEDFQTTLKSLRDVVLTWDDATMCYPGHGPAFMLGSIRPVIEAFLERPHPADFHGDAEW